jgi:hypothetical protein
MVTFRPASAGPSQTCWPPICKFPEGGTTRSASTAGSSGAGSVTARAGSAATGWPALEAAPGSRSSSVEAAGANRLAGKAMPGDWCGRLVL